MNVKDFKHSDSTAQKLCETILNYITESCTWHTCVTQQGTNYELPEDDTTVSKHIGGVW